jgi:hypothetical protein
MLFVCGILRLKKVKLLLEQEKQKMTILTVSLPAPVGYSPKNKWYSVP